MSRRQPMGRVAAIAAIALLTTGQAGAAAEWGAVIKATTPSVPRLEMDHDGQRGVCSGAVFDVDPKEGWAYALTAAHCVEHKPTARFNLTANDRTATAVAFNVLLDLAIIRFRARDERPMPLAAKVPESGSPVAVVGYAFGVESIVAQFGHVAQAFNRESKSVWIDAMTIFGDSGGAVIDASGALIAVTSQIYYGGHGGEMAHIGAAVPIDAVKDFIDDFQSKRRAEAKQ